MSVEQMANREVYNNVKISFTRTMEDVAAHISRKGEGELHYWHNCITYGILFHYFTTLYQLPMLYSIKRYVLRWLWMVNRNW